MPLKAVVYPQTQDPFAYYKDFYNYSNLLLNGDELHWGYEDGRGSGSIDFLENQTENYPFGDWNGSSSPRGGASTAHLRNTDSSNSAPSPRVPKRQRAKSRKNKEQIESQRMTHIAVERNRRKQMNEYLSVLRSLMPDSYVQRGDQASIIGGAINFVKELEQRMHFLGSAKKKLPNHVGGGNNNSPFHDFFTFPQYSTTTSAAAASGGSGGCCDNSPPPVAATAGDVHCGVADIEVTMVESHANVKVRTKKRPKQLLKMVSGLQNMRLAILHLNVTTTGDDVVLYSLSLKVEDDCKLGSVDDIAGAVYQIMDRIQQEAINVELIRSY